MKQLPAKILAVCCMYISIANNMSSMGLLTKTVNAVQNTTKKSFTRSQFFACGNCTKCHAPDRDNCPAKDSTCYACQKTGHWKQKCKKSNEVGVLEGVPTFDEVMIHAWLANQKRPEDPRQITDISIDTMTEAFATVDMSIASNRDSLWCKMALVQQETWHPFEPL